MPNEKSIEMRLPSLDELFSSQEERDDAKLCTASRVTDYLINSDLRAQFGKDKQLIT